ncbi:MAG TPA: transposase [Candidatus Methylomirabilis sp.]
MPRGPRLDAPGALHHVMVRGLERRAIFRDARDRDNLVHRLAALAEAGAITLYAWALLPNHFHLLVRTGNRPLARAMRSLLTGYAGAFNRRHRRTGHLFQNRYKSILVEEEPYFLELVRYLHLNPLRAGVVRDLRGLERYPWTGHAALLGRRATARQDTQAVLARFARRPARARARYRAFVAAGTAQGKRPELQGGGLVRSLGGWAAVRNLGRGRERWVSDERVLGSSAFVEALRTEADRAAVRTERARAHRLTREGVVQAVCRAVGVAPGALPGGGRLPAVSRARAGIAYLWIEVLGRSGRHLAPVLGIRPAAIYRAAQRGRTDATTWERLLERK